MKCRKVLMEAEGLGKDLESRMLSRGHCGWATPLGNIWPALGKEGSPVGQRMERDGKGEEADSCRNRKPPSPPFLPGISALSVVANSNV